MGGKSSPRPKVPMGLGSRGKRFWNSVVEVYELRPDELFVLEDACHEADMVARLEAESQEATLTAAGSMGQLVAHPVIIELRQHRSTFARLVKQLNLPDEPGGQKKDASSRARDAANARWSVVSGT